MQPVQITNGQFPPENDIPEFKNYPFELDDFQKWAIDAIKSDINVLATAKTGAGKTVIAEYAIRKCLAEGRKVIYTSPIKSLSNQKFKEFSQKFRTGPASGLGANPIGIITGDIKFNPEASCLIMTTEILRNLLYYHEVVLDHITGLSLKMDVGREVGAVIFDEVHYINDRERGRVWEECFILLPREIELVLLSATIDRAEEFGGWLQALKQKPLRLIQTERRVVPLKHYLFWNWISNQKALDKLERDDPVGRKRLEKFGSLELVPVGAEGEFDVETYREVYSLQQKYGHSLMLGYREILNQLVDFLRDRQMLPAIFFTLSRRKCQEYSRMISRSLNDGDEQAEVDRIIERELRKLENFERYRQLEEFVDLRACLIKGLAYHHSGLIPVFKEIIEILYAQNLVKVLIATETFAVGVNMPTKTVVFTGLTKIDDSPSHSDRGSVRGSSAIKTSDFRWLESHEYTQMTGRAGRRGLDKLGQVILLPNLYQLPPVEIMKHMKLGAPPRVVSRFSLNYQLILRVVLNNTADLATVIKGSLWFREIESEITACQRDLTKLREWKAEIETRPESKAKIIKDNFIFSEAKNLKDVLIEGLKYKELLKNCNEMDIGGLTIKVNPKILKKNRQLAEQMRNAPGFAETWKQFQTEIEPNLKRLEQLESESISSDELISGQLEKVYRFLSDYDYINWTPGVLKLDASDLLTKGILASRVSQCQEMLLVEMLTFENKTNINNEITIETRVGVFEDLLAEEVVAVLASFSDLKLESEIGALDNKLVSSGVIKAVHQSREIADTLAREEERRGLMGLDSNWELSLSLVTGAYIWARGGSWAEVLAVCPTFSGNLVKELLKVNHLSQELAGLAKIMGHQRLLTICEEIPARICRGIVNVESLYLK